ncbi:MAG: 50S ribosomal protein L6 [Chloroflexi bacterium]|nr:50S ribosomal protein L6 [Chloroflexota bacterium]
MSKVGNKPIVLPKEVQVQVAGAEVQVQGLRGALSLRVPPAIAVRLDDGSVVVERSSDRDEVKALHGTMRSLLNNMILGVSIGYQKALEIVGVGFRAQQAGEGVILQVGFSHPVELKAIEGVKIQVENPARVVVSGVDKQRVGEMAARIRAVHPPDHYKGKGVRYAGEVVRLKPGKAAAKKA